MLRETVEAKQQLDEVREWIVDLLRKSPKDKDLTLNSLLELEAQRKAEFVASMARSVADKARTAEREARANEARIAYRGSMMIRDSAA